jgi:hypothetical protein
MQRAEEEDWLRQVKRQKSKVKRQNEERRRRRRGREGCAKAEGKS